MRTSLNGLIALCGALAVAVGTRVPGDFVFVVASCALAVLAAGTAVVATQRPTGKRSGALLFVLVLGQLVIPTSPSAIAAFVPPWAVALSVGLALHGVFANSGTKAPLVSTTIGTPNRTLLQYAPAAVILLLLIGLPLLYVRILPDRIRAAYELTTAFGPLVPLIAASGVLLFVGLLRQGLEWMRRARGKAEIFAPPPLDGEATGP